MGPHWVPWPVGCKMRLSSLSNRLDNSGVPVGTLITLAREWDDVVAVQRVQQAVGALKI